VLDSLDDAERRDVVAAAKPLLLKTHDILAQQGAPAAHFYVIEIGRLRISHTAESGQETAARTAGAGQSFGGSLLMGRPRYLQSARAQQPSRIMAWARPTLLALIDKYPNGVPNDDGSIDIVHALSRQDLTLLIGAEPREVSMTLSAWENDRLLQLSSSHVRLLDQARLEALLTTAGAPLQQPGTR
jgi:CRP-like cAMP-binding protein